MCRPRTMPFIVVVVSAVACLVLATSCSYVPGQAESSTTSTPSASGPAARPADGITSIPCFRCHAPERFRDPAVFPHESHRSMGLHCNQCHIVKSHEEMALNGDTCKSCHNLDVIELSSTSMPATFEHTMHAGMFSCGECHQDLFKMKAGSTAMDMQAISAGKFCGKCHNGTVASAPDNCSSCHGG